MTGRLLIVGTPIGNLGDLSPRGREALAGADAVACEDTRRTGRLLSTTGVGHRPLLMVNEHTEAGRLDEIVERIANGEQVALVSDAGMPIVSDPGRRVVEAVAAAGQAIEVVPGPVAASSALALSGFDGSRFVFDGFLPRKGKERARRLEAIAAETRTVVLYEAPHRLCRTLADLVEACGPGRAVAAARELTKLHEEVVRGRLDEVAAHFDEVAPRGEFALVVEGAAGDVEPLDDAALLDALRHAVDAGATRRDAVAEVAAATGEPKRRVYDLALRLGSGR